MAADPIYRGWDILGRASRSLKRSITDIGKSVEARQAEDLADNIAGRLADMGLDEAAGRNSLARLMAVAVLARFLPDGADVEQLPFCNHLADRLLDLLHDEELFDLPEPLRAGRTPLRSEIWEVEDQLRRTEKILDNLDEAVDHLVTMVAVAIEPILARQPALLQDIAGDDRGLRFATPLSLNLTDLPEIIEHLVQVPFAPDLETFDISARLKQRLEYNLVVASGGVPGDPRGQPKTLRLPTKAPPMPSDRLIKTYLEGTAFADLFAFDVPVVIPEETRFEHHHIVAGSGHGKTQTLQQLILHDLEAVAEGRASIVVIDSQSDLINTIAGLDVFAPGRPLADRLCLIDPTDVEWPVALNLFDVGMERINQYSELDRERLINGVLELYDFVLGSLLDAGLTQKQSIIFRYITRLLLHIPDATIHTFRELLEDGGSLTYQEHIAKLEGTARAFFENEFDGKEFVQTKKQVLRRLYGILENRTFERMFSHPRSKLDLFTEMNAGKVILVNTAKDLLKENGTEIFGRFFIALIAQAAQERAVLEKEKRLPTFVYVDEANDYFDRNIGIILSQVRKYKIGMVLAHQLLGQLDGRLQEAILANTSIKFAGGVSAKDARALAGDLRSDPGFIEEQGKLSFAAFVKGTTKHAVSLSVTPGQMEGQPRMSAEDREALRDTMRERYAVHYSEIGRDRSKEATETDEPDNDTDEPPAADDDRPMPW